MTIKEQIIGRLSDLDKSVIDILAVEGAWDTGKPMTKADVSNGVNFYTMKGPSVREQFVERSLIKLQGLGLVETTDEKYSLTEVGRGFEGMSKIYGDLHKAYKSDRATTP